MKAWIARDKSGELWLYIRGKPNRDSILDMWSSGNSIDYVLLDPDLFPEVKWEDDEPTEVEITIKPKKKWRVRNK